MCMNFFIHLAVGFTVSLLFNKDGLSIKKNQKDWTGMKQK